LLPLAAPEAFCLGQFDVLVPPGPGKLEAMKESRTPNRLAQETSPYLLQHAHNPVDWYPWGPEALERARSEDKPILLSIGYAACHWCHVMERESFEDEEIARAMNEGFVSVKVDREERPDLDAVYMEATQRMTGHGGWPMTVFLTPEGVPFFAGTYFPKEDRHGLPSFRRVLEAMRDAWRDQRDRIAEQGDRVMAALNQAGGLRESAEPITEELLLRAHGALRQAFDPYWGGFGGAPKFPQPMTLEYLLRCHLRRYPAALDMVERTLDAMSAGGMYDHVGGGFHRYSVDERWHVPHFEKMLYDNAQLARVYSRAWQVTGKDRYRCVARETLDYLVREMRHPGGGFFSSQDADTEGEEGRYYAWTWDELVEVAGTPVATLFGARPEGNWEGTNVLWTPSPLERIAQESAMEPDELGALLEQARQRLLDRRERRVRPGTDDKILAAWNGLAISAFAEAGRIFGQGDLVDRAAEAADFVLSDLRSGDGRLLRSWRDGRGGKPGFLDDHAMVAEACLTLYETTFDLRWFREARSLGDEMLRLFPDQEAGGFFQTGADAETLVVRPKELFDNAVPSGNSVAAEVLQRLALLTGETDYERAAISALRVVRDLMERTPSGLGHALCAADLYVGKTREVAVVGDPQDEDTRGLIATVRERFRPNLVLAVAGPDDRVAAAEVPLLKDRPPVDGAATAYVCERFVCQKPVTDPAALSEQLEK
jgi:uncharacterized protein